MRRGSRRTIGVLLLAATGLTAACSAGAPRDIDGPKTASLLFSGDRSAQLATQIGRSEWPATYGRFEGPEDTVYLEYYRDAQGSESEERSNPRRLFRSYRIGTQHR